MRAINVLLNSIFVGTILTLIVHLQVLHSIREANPLLAMGVPGENHGFDHIDTGAGVERGRGMSSCVLFMDDNHHLTEWISYHYYALPLRHLVIALVPGSKSNPKIHPRWRGLIDIDIWSDSDYLTEDLSPNEEDSGPKLLQKFVNRQGSFYQACSKYLQGRNRSWTTYHDVDEFLTISQVFFASQEVANSSLGRGIGNSSAFVTQPGHVLSLLEGNGPAFPSEKLSQTQDRLSQVCIHVPKAMFSAVESPPQQQFFPKWIDPDKFDTLRYRYQLTEKGGHDGLAKAVIDVSRLTPADLQSGGKTHFPILSVCEKRTVRRKYGSLPLGIHHYLGSWESYSFREDVRAHWLRTHDKWLRMSTKQDGGMNDEICSWMNAFIGHMGILLAKDLLENAGLPKTVSNNYTAFSRGNGKF